MLKKHILSKYNEPNMIGNLGNVDNSIAEPKTSKNSALQTRYIDGLPYGARTEETRLIEVSDSDEIVSRAVIMNGVNLTQADEYANIIIEKDIVINSKLCGPTLLTENIEISDPDELSVIGATNKTSSVESSDPDEFLN